jgi:drug/metabolite transporter (DMT)-like permease
MMDKMISPAFKDRLSWLIVAVAHLGFLGWVLLVLDSDLRWITRAAALLASLLAYPTVFEVLINRGIGRVIDRWGEASGEPVAPSPPGPDRDNGAGTPE